MQRPAIIITRNYKHRNFEKIKGGFSLPSIAHVPTTRPAAILGGKKHSKYIKVKIGWVITSL
jgi:hypothetical protein